MHEPWMPILYNRKFAVKNRQNLRKVASVKILKKSCCRYRGRRWIVFAWNETKLKSRRTSFKKGSYDKYIKSFLELLRVVHIQFAFKAAHIFCQFNNKVILATKFRGSRKIYLKAAFLAGPTSSYFWRSTYLGSSLSLNICFIKTIFLLYRSGSRLAARCNP